LHDEQRNVEEGEDFTAEERTKQISRDKSIRPDLCAEPFAQKRIVPALGQRYQGTDERIHNVGNNAANVTPSVLIKSTR